MEHILKKLPNTNHTICTSFFGSDEALDKLYNFLDGIINRDNITIYRFSPHGSKKLDDLTHLKRYNKNNSMTDIEMFCHDQEPLDFDLYKNVLPKNVHIPEQFEELIQYRKEYGRGLKSIAGSFGNNLNDFCLLLHSEKNSVELERYQNNGYIGTYYWSHALIAQDWFRFARNVQWRKQVDKRFLIYTGGRGGGKSTSILLSILASIIISIAALYNVFSA